MNKNISTIFTNFTYATTSNLISLFISILITLFIPKIIGVEDFGFWQVYLFYASYVGFLHLGWNDGIYLKYGGVKYENLDKNVIFSQFWSLTIFQFIIAVILFIFANAYVVSLERVFILNAIAVNLFLTNTSHFLLYVLQATNRIKDYSKITAIDRIIYMTLIVFLIVLGISEFRILVIADLIGKLFSLIFCIYICKDIVVGQISKFYMDFKEIYDNLKIGLNLMFANIASSLIIGTVRFGVEQSWDVSTFGKVSLTLSISHLLMRFISALGLVIYPILRRTKKSNLSLIYLTLKDILITLLFASLIVFFPLKLFLTYWLPAFSEGLEFMSIVFPIIVFEGKVVLLTNTYLKVLRKEREMLIINLLTMSFSVLLTLLSTLIFRNLLLSMVSILLLLIFKSTLAEIYLGKLINVSVKNDIFKEVILTAIFVIVSWNINSWNSTLIYTLSYLCFLYLKKESMKRTFKNMKSILL